MIQTPPIPSWDGLHPLIIDFPIALLLVAPLLVLIGALQGGHISGFSERYNFEVEARCPLGGVK